MADDAAVRWQEEAEAEAHRFGLQLTSVPPDGRPAIAGQMWLVRLDADNKPSANPADCLPCKPGDWDAFNLLIQQVSGPAREP